ncbi:MAG TPA: transposase [Paludibacter sp.]
MNQTKHPQWALDQKRPGTELRLIRGIYYLYEYKTVYDKQRKGPRKITGKILGRVTQEGFIPSGKRQMEQALSRTVNQSPGCREYGASMLVAQTFNEYTVALKKFFPEHWRHLLAIAYCRFVYRCPLKLIPFRVDQSYLSIWLKTIRFNDKTASSVLNTVGAMHEQMLGYMKSFIARDEYLLMDLTHVFSKSDMITLSHKGYNNQLNFDPQFNLMYLYSSKSRMPVYYKVLPGNIREVRAFKNCILEAGLNDAVIVADKGFYSKKNIDLLQKEQLRFILPLRRDNTIIDYSLLNDNSFKAGDCYFEHEKRMIWYRKYTYGDLSLFIYLDDSLKLKEEKDYLRRIDTHPENYSLTEYHKRKDTFGTIVLLTDFQRKPAVEVYETYKSRMAIETLFDSMKNVLEADHTYMQDEQTLHGWMFVNHITLQWYQHLYIELKKKNLLSKYSVNDYIQLLTDLKKIKINDQWHFNEITSKTQKMIEKLDLAIPDYNT